MNINEQLKQFIENNYTKLLTIVTNITKNRPDSKDILHEAFMSVLLMTDKKKREIMPFLSYYLIQVIKYSAFGKKSPYFQKNKQVDIDYEAKLDLMVVEEEPVTLQHITMIDVNRIMKAKLGWYEAAIWKRHVIDGKTFQEMATETKIPLSSLYKTFRQTVKIIKTEYYAEKTRKKD